MSKLLISPPGCGVIANNRLKFFLNLFTIFNYHGSCMSDETINKISMEV